MKILVPVKRVADPDNANKMKVSPDGTGVTSEGLEWKVNPFDEYAVEAALRLNEKGGSGETLGETVVVSLGPNDVQQTLRQPLAMGADKGVLIDAEDETLDSVLVAKALKAVVDKEQPDLVLMGKQAVDGDSNTAGQMLAEMLGWPMATFAMSIEAVDDGKALKVGREVDTGVLTLKLTLPAVVTVDLRIVTPQAVKNGVTPDDHAYNEGARYASLKGIMKAKKKPIDQMSLADLGVEGAPAVQYSKFELPPARSGSVTYVESVDELVQKLQTDAKVL
ncbi:MAG TPA: electron transfer flavoprotein subunit beta/FixA family protein [Sandaracinaceae bacterium LLY-WYZ-13_1]|nr:electron transfer flavoprotein subunit beta/FixA family protein [Sandaracinaceae bacterium LLY-WYZ-13_1]